MRRPFYAEYAWAFDLLVDRPVRKECAVIAAWLIERGVLPGAEVLDAGCGTGRYALELARRGYVVHGVDLSPELIDLATRAIAGSTGRVSFGVGDIAHLPTSRYAAILCRGVLNDVIDDARRDTVLRAFAEALHSERRVDLGRPGMVRLFRTEDSGAALQKARGYRPRRVDLHKCHSLDPENRQLLISERHELIKEGAEMDQ